MASLPTTMSDHFGAIPDPRVDRQKLHSLHDIIVIAICGTICGADGWVRIQRFGEAKRDWFKSFLELPNGIPSHDTFGRVFSALDPVAFREAFVSWVAAISEAADGEIVAVDGKTLRRSFDAASGKKAIHRVNAWATKAGVSLGQLATEEKSNEITAIPKLLKLLDLKGCIVTTDAMGCQKTIAKETIDGEGDYVLALKGNQGTLHDDVVRFFEWAAQAGRDAPRVEERETVDGEHGRIEIRRYSVSDDIAWLPQAGEWEGLRTIAKVQSERTVGDETSVETRYYISSKPAEQTDEIAKAIRGHWGVENGLHWVLDLAFREDESRVRMGHAAENLATVRQIALNLLKSETSAKVGVATKRLMAGWDEQYLSKVLGF